MGVDKAEPKSKEKGKGAAQAAGDAEALVDPTAAAASALEAAAVTGAVAGQAGVAAGAAAENVGDALANTTAVAQKATADAAGDLAKQTLDTALGDPQQLRKNTKVFDKMKSSFAGEPMVLDPDPTARERWWEMSMNIKTMTNLTPEAINFFFTVIVEGVDKRREPQVKLLHQYTPKYRLEPEKDKEGCTKSLPNGYQVYDKINFCLSYKDLARHNIKVDMWKVHPLTFNKYFGVYTELLSKSASKDANRNLMIRRMYTKKQEETMKREKKAFGHVALVDCVIQVEEIFDFYLHCDNWMLEMSHQHPNEESLKQERKKLTFTMPKDKRSLPGQTTLAGSCMSYTTEWNRDETFRKTGQYFWATCAPKNQQFVFRGTRTYLQNSYFTVAVHTGIKWPQAPPTGAQEALQDRNPLRKPLGCALLNLTSVLETSVFSGKVKSTKIDKADSEERYILGDITGNVKCILRSKGLPAETDLRTPRPMQIKSATSVSHLSKHDKHHLVVKVIKCIDLPSGDFDGLSDPFLKVTWDNVVQTSAIHHGTIRPVFNETFFFPVRMANFKILSQEKKYAQALKLELESRSTIKIEVWDDDNFAQEYLGSARLLIDDILRVATKSKVNIQGATKKEKSEEDADEPEGEAQHGNKLLENYVPVRLYDGARTPLQLTSKANQQALIWFKAFFYPDFDDSLILKKEKEGDDAKSLWEDKAIEWTNDMGKFTEDEYAVAFPDAIGAKRVPAFEDGENFGTDGEQVRRFVCVAKNGLATVPLMAFISSIIIPESFAYPSNMLHWMQCLRYENSSKQYRTGLIPTESWKDPDMTMQRRRGAPQDLAVLLCSFLLGCKKDAWVCKGTVLQKDTSKENRKDMLIEHVWVMTKEAGWVTFWEPCSRQVFHLPKRYTYKAKPQANKSKKNRLRQGGVAGADDAMAEDDVEDEEDQADDTGENKGLWNWEEEVEDARIRVEDMEALPTIGRMPKPKSKVGNKSKADKEGREKQKEWQQSHRDSLPIAPKREMLEPKTLVNWLPYDSIEIVFNKEQLYGNLQNHHPACINYDFEDPDDDDVEEEKQEGKDKKEKEKPKPRWKKLKDEKANPRDGKAKVIPINEKVSVGPEMREDAVGKLMKELKAEMKQNLTLYRSKRGQDALFDDKQELMDQLGMFLKIQEDWLKIDPDFYKVSDLLNKPEESFDLKDPKTSDGFIRAYLEPKQWNERGSPFFQKGGDAFLRDMYDPYHDYQDKLWTSIKDDIDAFMAAKKKFPVQRGKRFKGFPVHFSTPEHESIRTYLMNDGPTKSGLDYRSFIERPEEDIVYTIECKIFPLLGGVLSVWLYIGIQEPDSEDKGPAKT